MLIFGNQKFKLESVDSTNNFAAKLIVDKICRNGAVVLADEQTQGKGQRGNVWVAKHGENLTCSFIWLPDNMAVSSLHSLNWIVGIVMVEVLKRYGIIANVKWPNDLIVNQHKIAGILIETESDGMIVKSIIIGLGLNINQTVFQNDKAISMCQITGHPYIIDDVLQVICDELNHWCNYLNQPEFLLASYNKYLFKRNELNMFLIKNIEIEGKIKQVNAKGRLEVAFGTEVQEFEFKEITMIY